MINKAPGMSTSQSEVRMVAQIARWQFTVEDYHQMHKTGILAEDDHVELLDGEVRAMSPIGSFHAAIVKRLNALLSRLIGSTAIISVQDPVQLDDYSEPQPDVAVLRLDDTFYATSHPTANDALLVIEVSDTSLEYDRDEKIPRYAHAGIREVWLIDVAQEVVEQYTQPRGDQYGAKQTFARGEVIRATTVEDVAFPVDQLFG
jgi:Uma2 family endonuclease